MFIKTKNKFLPIICVMLLLPALSLKVALPDTVLCIGKKAHVAIEPMGLCTEYYGSSSKPKSRGLNLFPMTAQVEKSSTECTDISLIDRFLKKTDTKTKSVLFSIKLLANSLYNPLASIHSETLLFSHSLLQDMQFEKSNVSSLRTTILIV